MSFYLEFVCACNIPVYLKCSVVAGSNIQFHFQHVNEFCVALIFKWPVTEPISLIFGVKELKTGLQSCQIESWSWIIFTKKS